VCSSDLVQATELPKVASTLQNELAINNFGKVSESVWRGSVPSDKSLEKLAKHGVKTVIDLRYKGFWCKHEEEQAAKFGLKYVHMPIGFSKLTSNEILSFLKIVSNPANLPAYVHCRQGADRTGVIIGAYRILMQNWTFDKTYNEMRAYHFKPWLFNMKKSVAKVADNELSKEALKIASTYNNNLALDIPLK